jgi:hypothetical protein
MIEQDKAHLQSEQMIWAVIDRDELAGDARHHLLACPVCRGKVEDIQNELQEFGRKACQAVPPLSSPVKLPEESKTAVKPANGWLPFCGAAAMAAFIIFFYFMGMKTMFPAKVTTLQNQETLLEDETLMREISKMVENPLPEDLDEITGEIGTDFDDNFLDFIVPVTLDDFQS